MSYRVLTGLLGIAFATVTATAVLADPPGDPAAASEENGRYYDADGNPTYKIQEDGTVDWLTYSGFRRYHSECHVCHGPEGMGSSYAPALIDSLKTIDYPTFLEIVASGRQNVSESKQSVMPAFGTNLNVMCYIDDIYVYLRARSDGALGRIRPKKREDKSPEIRQTEDECLGRS